MRRKHGQMNVSLRHKADLLNQAIEDVDLEKVKEVMKSCNGDARPLFDAYEKMFRSQVMHCVIRLYDAVDAQLDTKLAIVEELVTTATNVYGCTPNDFTLLYLAIVRHNLPLTKLLFKLGGKWQSGMREWESRIVSTAAVMGGPEYLTCLFENNVTPTDSDDELNPNSGLYRALRYSTFSQREGACVIMFVDWYEAHQRPFPSYKALNLLISYKAIDVATTIWHRATLTAPQIHALFSKAAEYAFTKFMRLMIAWYPQLLHSKWLMKGDIPAKLKGDADFLHWLNDMSSQPAPLLYLCKAVIMRNIGRNPESRVDTLPLPKQTKEFLLSHLES